MSNIKSIIKKSIGYKNLNYLRYIKSLNKKKIDNNTILKLICNCKMYSSYKKLFANINLCNKSEYFFYSLDYYKSYLYDGDVIANLMLDYSKVLNYSLNDFAKELTNDDYHKELKELIESINILIDREIDLCEDEVIKNSLYGIKDRKASSFFDALQRILFFNQLMWQTGHYLNGLGRLDILLEKYYINDVKEKKLTKDDAYKLLKEFLIVLHNDYYYKSNSLAGDTGQIIIIGGKDNKDNYCCNDLTYMFIDLIKELNEPDPKLLLRVSTKTPRDLIEKSIDCIATGIGCPLFANDDIIIDKLVEYGFDKNEVYDYGTAACWEPFITGKSFDQNNIRSICFANPLNEMLCKEDLNEINSFKDFVEKYKEYLNIYLNNFINDIDTIKFGKDLLLSLFTDECIEREKDISCGGAKYNNYGFTGVGLSNTINSLFSLKTIVFDKKKYSLIELNNIRLNNYVDNENLINDIKNDVLFKYGSDYDEVIELTNDIIKFTSKALNMVNPLGGKYKFGLSAPSYIDESRNFPATFDGRKNNEPFGVHISSDISNGYTELINFASKLDYNENRFNGNVVDFFVSPNFIKDNFEKFVDFITLSIKKGFFEMQMNVVNSKTLIEARQNPEKFPNLIVRVWGFSAYFKDLPDEYKDYLIERALKSEGYSK